MTIKEEIKKEVIAEFSKDEREILYKARVILLNANLEIDKFDDSDLPMNKGDFHLVSDIYDYSSEIQNKIFFWE